MKKLLIILSTLCLFLTSGCTNSINQSHISDISVLTTDIPDSELGDDDEYVYEADFESLDDENLRTYLEATIYQQIVQTLPEQDWLIDNVETKYVSTEYLQELEYNSKSNVFFGYTLDEIEKVYKDKQYVFTLEDGDTVVQPFEDYDETFERVIKNVAVGSGVILICVTVSAIASTAGAPAVAMIFATSAQTGTQIALSSGTISAAVSGIAVGVQTGDMEKAFKAAALSGSESFKWGAITGAAAGGASEAIALKGSTTNGLTMNQAAIIQKESGYPLDMIKEFHSVDEYKAFHDAGLKPAVINGRSALIRNDIDLNQLDEYGRTNLQRMTKGLSPLDKTGKSFELHHVGQKNDGTLAILSTKEHDNPFLHGYLKTAEINRPEFDGIRKEFWKTMANVLTEGAV